MGNLGLDSQGVLYLRIYVNTEWFNYSLSHEFISLLSFLWLISIMNLITTVIKSLMSCIKRKLQNYTQRIWTFLFKQSWWKCDHLMYWNKLSLDGFFGHSTADKIHQVIFHILSKKTKLQSLWNIHYSYHWRKCLIFSIQEMTIT